MNIIGKVILQKVSKSSGKAVPVAIAASTRDSITMLSKVMYISPKKMMATIEPIKAYVAEPLLFLKLQPFIITTSAHY